MRIIEREQISRVIDLPQALEAVTRSFELQTGGQVTAPPVAHLGFTAPPGDCHIKAAHIQGQPTFTVKISTGFYDNPAHGRPSSDGLVLLFSAETGEPLALLNDRGLITDLRTALAGVVATSLARPDGPDRVGIVGTGTQARLQLECLHRLQGPVPACVWGRSSTKVADYVDAMRDLGVEVEPCQSIEELCDRCDTLITTTPATRPLIDNSWVRPGTHITAVGADAPQKQELDQELFRRARGVLVDSRAQCVDHGEVSHAVAAGILAAESNCEVGAALAGQEWQANAAGDVTIADLTGLAASDAMMAQTVWAALDGDATSSRPRP